MNRDPLLFILVKVMIVKLPRSGALPAAAKQVDALAADTPVFATFSMWWSSYYLRRPSFVKILLPQQTGLLMLRSASTNDGPAAV